MRLFPTNTKATRRTGLARAAWFSLLLAVACGPAASEHPHEGEDDHETESGLRGSNGGLLYRSDTFELELGIFESGIPPEYRAWAKADGQPLEPSQFSLEVSLSRLGGRVDRIAFEARGDHLVSTRSIEEPHSFEVSIAAEHSGARHNWSFESIEGRTQIDAAMAESLGVATEHAGAATLAEVVTVYGRVRANPERLREIRARFEGELHTVHASVGDRVRKGAPLLTIESNESLNLYVVTAPIAGTVTQRDANTGEQTMERLLMTITDTSSVWVELAVFPVDRRLVAVGQAVSVTPALGGSPAFAEISLIGTEADPHDQSVAARVELNDPGPQLLPGTFVTAEVKVGEYELPLAVRRSGLQSFRDGRVVYAVVGDVYEVRMLELGRSAGDWVEVRGGLEPGTQYVTRNSHLIKADIEKSGASHDH